MLHIVIYLCFVIFCARDSSLVRWVDNDHYTYRSTRVVYYICKLLRKCERSNCAYSLYYATTRTSMKDT